ncbi:MAG: hypothetical protein CMI16_11620 [Opitutaceae bacterium]|nr:hypothetical protein [Opitutaceae bacterium]
MSTSTPLNLIDQLFPRPRHIVQDTGTHCFNEGPIVCAEIEQPIIRRSAHEVQSALKTIKVEREISEYPDKGESATVELVIDPQVAQHQGYAISITPDSITLAGHDEAGLAYAATTFAQLISAVGSIDALPCLTITDWPDFEKRGIMLDISRDKVPTMETLFLLVDRMASWKMNELQLYTEHTFAYANHHSVWAGASPMTPAEILELDAYCQDRGIELVPNQNTFGHFEKWLKHDTYAHLAECPEPTDIIAWNKPMTVSKGSLSPVDQGSLELIDELLTELLPHFSSKMINVGGDETIELGYGRSKEKCEEIGKGRVYLNYLIRLREIAARQGRKIQFWGDIIMHHPELIPEIPKDVIALVWGYEITHPFDEECAAFKASGLEFYVCPGTSSWNSQTGRHDTALKNIRSAAENGIKHGAIGYLVTDWGDGGHWQPLGTAYPLYAYSAAVSWAHEANIGIDLAQVINTHIYHDSAEKIGPVLMQLGDAATLTKLSPHNSTVFHQLYHSAQTPLAEHEFLKELKVENLQRAQQAITQAQSDLELANPSSTDGPQAIQEIALIADLALHGCKQGLYRFETPKGSIDEVATEKRQELREELATLVQRHRDLWVGSNRIGGMKESAEKMEKNLAVY